MFLAFKVPAVFLATGAALALVAAGGSTGLVVESGAANTYIVPVYEGSVLPHAIVSLGFGGATLTTYFIELLYEASDVPFRTSTERDIAEEAKKKMCYVAQVAPAAMAMGRTATLPSSEQLFLPNGDSITVDSQRFRCPEALFDPSVIGNGSMSDGLHQCIYKSISRCETELWKDLYPNVVLSGGNSMFQGIANRVQTEVQALAPSQYVVKVIAPPERQHSVWIGGSILASLSTFQQMWISKAEYDMFGPSAIHCRCF
jgi:actin